ncbi:MAG: stage II sporulation protein M [Bacteroidetes bacterium]|nr:stage II sporulation protein M [Bacteroidota bacterium]
MRESKFIDQNREKWQQYEQGIKNNTLDAEKMERAFIELNDDLAYAQTFYKNRSVRVFLNNLLSPVYNRIYRGRSLNRKSVATFFIHDAPLMNFRARHFMLISLITVMLGFSTGFFGTRHDYQFAYTVLGNRYVEMTEKNIEKKDPLAVYKSSDAAEMFFRIATNNLSVAFYFFLFGALFCVGTLYLLFMNGIVLGVFTYMFTSRGLATEYLLTVYQHGTLEILTMVIEGAAGLMMGAGFLFPGTISRLQSIQEAARRSIIMFLVCIPIIILAAFIESYLTRHTEIPNAARSMVLILSFLFMLYYFVIYPWWRFRGDKQYLSQSPDVKAEKNNGWKPGKLYRLGETILLSFQYLKSNAGALLTGGAIVLSAWWGLSHFMGDGGVAEDVEFQLRRYATVTDESGYDGNLAASLLSQLEAGAKLIFFNLYASNYLLAPGLFSVFFYTWAALFTAFLLPAANFKHFHSGNNNTGTYKRLVLSAMLSLVLSLLLLVSGSLWWLTLLLTLPIFAGYIAMFSDSEKHSFSKTTAIVFENYFEGFLRMMGAVLVCLLLYFLTMFGIWFLVTIILAFSSAVHGLNSFSDNTLLFFVRVNYVILPAIISLTTFVFVSIHFVLREKLKGRHLLNNIRSISFKKSAYGVETE